MDIQLSRLSGMNIHTTVNHMEIVGVCQKPSRMPFAIGGNSM